MTAIYTIASFLIFWKLVTSMITVQPCNLVQLVRKIFAESLFPYISGWKASDRGKLSWETCSKQRTSRRAAEIPDVLLPVIFYFFYSPPIKVDPAQKFRESCALHQSSAVKREVSSAVGTLRVNQKAGNVLSSLVFNFNFQATEDFFNQFDLICGTGYCEFMLKKLDKKRERRL